MPPKPSILKQLSATAASSTSSKPFVKLTAKNVLTHVAVGMGAASFWRGAWYILDDHLFPDDAAKSASASLGSWDNRNGGITGSHT